MSDIQVGKTYRTPWEPSGLFRVTLIEPPQYPFGETAFGVFVGDHPAGYADGSFGRYYSHELAGREVSPCDSTTPS
jgi:hypothetical protein